MGIDAGLNISGGRPDGGERPVRASLNAAATVRVGAAATPLGAQLAVSGTDRALAANLTLEGTAAPVMARLSGTIAPIIAGVTADIAELPEVGIRLRQIPPFQLTAPTEY